jgi:hypothetical protein
MGLKASGQLTLGSLHMVGCESPRNLHDGNEPSWRILDVLHNEWPVLDPQTAIPSV